MKRSLGWQCVSLACAIAGMGSSDNRRQRQRRGRLRCRTIGARYEHSVRRRGMTGDPVNGGGGSEIDQVFGTVANGRLYVTIAGQPGEEFQQDGCVHRLQGRRREFTQWRHSAHVVDGFAAIGGGTNLPNPADGALQRMDGLTFDAGFDADYFLAFTHGPETVNPNMPDSRQFWAASAHYADLSNGTAGAVVAAGMQLAPRGLPNALRFPGDYNKNGKVDGADYVIWRKTQGQTVARGSGADANGSDNRSAADYDIWRSRFDDGTTLADFHSCRSTWPMVFRKR